MSLRIRGALYASVAVFGLNIPQNSFAQSDQTAAGTASGLEEIVVTARKREERVQTVPLAVTAFSQAQIERQQVHQISDLAQLVPSLAFTGSTTDANAIYGQLLHLRALPGVEVYFADVPFGSGDFNQVNGLSHGLSPGNFYDLADVEVIKGPQGTLFGKNSIGGLISYQPQRPTNEWEGYLRTTFGNYNDKENEFAVNVPIVQDKVLLRVAGQMQQRDGYTHDVSANVDLDDINYYAWRVGVTVRPTDDLENYLVYDGYWQDTNGPSTITSFLNPGLAIFSLAPGLPPATPGIGPDITGLFNPSTLASTLGAGIKAGGFSLYPDLISQFQKQQALGPRNFLGGSYQQIGKDYFYGFTNVTRWDVTDDLTIKNIAAARVFKTLSNFNFISLGPKDTLLTIGVPGNRTGWSDNSAQYTEELQLQGKALNEKLVWVAGGYLEFDHPIGNSATGNGAFENTFIATSNVNEYHNSYRSQAAFIHGDYDLSDYVDGLKFTAGYRYTWDYNSVQSRGTAGTDQIIRNSAGVATNCAGLFGVDTNCYQSVSQHFSAFGWNLGLEEQLTPEVLLYVRSGNAYRPGGVNLNVPGEFSRFQPEHVTDVEFGVKADWDYLGVHGRTNADVFHTMYKSIQLQELVTFLTPQGTPSPQDLETNGGGATIDGGELETTVIPVEGVEISAHGSFVHAKYSEYPVTFSPLGTDTPFTFEPKLSYGVSGLYHLPINPSYGDIALSLTYSWYGHQVNSITPGEIFPILPSYDLLDVKVDWANMFGQPIDASFFMKNALDKLYVTQGLNVYQQLGATGLQYGPPRMFGFSLKYRFKGHDASGEAATAAYVPPPAIAPMVAPRSYLVFFDFNKSDLSQQAIKIVDSAAKNAGPAKVTQLTVTGHTDTVGSDAYNLRLSRRRAESVAARLENDGVPSFEIEIVANGKRNLLVPTADGVREPQNRRVQIVYDNGAAS